jgi:hypothetical protein
MSPINGYLTPEARATIDAVFAKLAAPGMCNPADVRRARARPGGIRPGGMRPPWRTRGPRPWNEVVDYACR